MASYLHPLIRREGTVNILQLSNDKSKEIHNQILKEMRGIKTSPTASQARNNSHEPAKKKGRYSNAEERAGGLLAFLQNGTPVQTEENERNVDELNLLSYYEEPFGSFELLDLEKYAKIRSLFLKFNLPPTSSASVERLFSRAKSVLTYSRSNLSDKSFEELLFVKVNREFDSSGNTTLI
jgi:hypothetical protein